MWIELPIIYISSKMAMTNFIPNVSKCPKIVHDLQTFYIIDLSTMALWSNWAWGQKTKGGGGTKIPSQKSHDFL